MWNRGWFGHAARDVNDKHNVARGSLHRAPHWLDGRDDPDDDAFVTGEGMDLDGGLRSGEVIVFGCGDLFSDGEAPISAVAATFAQDAAWTSINRLKYSVAGHAGHGEVCG